jgi:hypothetical protein
VWRRPIARGPSSAGGRKRSRQNLGHKQVAAFAPLPRCLQRCELLWQHVGMGLPTSVGGYRALSSEYRRTVDVADP